MKTKEPTTLEKRFERLKTENLGLRERLSSLKKESDELRKLITKKDTLLSIVPAGLVIIQKGKVKEINKTALDWLGYAEEDILERNFLNLVSSSAKAVVRDIHQRRIEGKWAPTLYEAGLVAKNGETVNCEVRIEKIRYGGRVAFVARLIGLEERKQRERELVQTKKLEAITTMASGLMEKYSLCTRLINDQTRRIKAHTDSENKALIESLNHMEAATSELKEVTETLAILSKERYEPSEVMLLDLRGVVEEAVKKVEAQLGEKATGEGAKVNVKTYLRAVSPVEGVPGELREVMVSLILNAVEAMPRGGDLHVSVEENAGSAYVYVQDSGVGIPEHITTRIMDPFFTTKGKNVSGLGLSIAQAILRRHRGDLEVASKKDRGTTITVRLPLSSKEQRPKAKPGRRKIKNARILIMEQDHLIRELISQLLVSKGCRVATADSVLEGLNKLKGNAFDMVIADPESADIKESVLVRKMRKADGEIAIALIKQHGAEEQPKGVKASPVDLFIHKPIDMNKVLNQVCEILMLKATHERPPS